MRKLEKKERFLLPSIILSLLLCFFTSCSTFSPNLSSNSEKDTIQNQLADLHKEIQGLRKDMALVRQAVTEIHRSSNTFPSFPLPAPSTVQVKLDDDPVLGNQEAKVGIIEFTDYQCPFCKRFHDQAFDKIKKTYIDTGKVQYIVRDFPLDFHSEAKGAALAANCAGEQGMFWEMKDVLFTQQRRLGDALYLEAAKNLHLDEETFNACLQDFLHAEEVEKDLAYGQSLGVRGTPNFFVGRVEGDQLVQARQITGAQPFSVFSQALDALLK